MSLSLILTVGLLTCFFSFGVQTLFYLWYKSKKHSLISQHRAVVNYASGIIGDGILVPLINIFAVISLSYLQRVYLNFTFFILALTLGFLTTSLIHYGQMRFALTNWTMPKVGKWNVLGLYHAIFMFLEISFLFYVLLNYIKEAEMFGTRLFLVSPIKFEFLVLFLFLMTFIYDYREQLFKKLLKRFY